MPAKVNTRKPFNSTLASKTNKNGPSICPFPRWYGPITRLLGHTVLCVHFAPNTFSSYQWTPCHPTRCEAPPTTCDPLGLYALPYERDRPRKSLRPQGLLTGSPAIGTGGWWRSK
jgi:hypothetical protein